MDPRLRAGSGHGDTRDSAIDFQRLHTAVLLGDVRTADVLASLALPRICGGLRREWPAVATATIEEAAEDAILWYLANPARYDPARSGLQTFLHLVARRKMTHAVRRERRRLAHEVPSGLSLPEAMPDYPAPAWRGGDEAGVVSRDLSNILALAMTDAERAFVLARATGAPIAALARIIGAGHSPDEQRRAVHRVIARLRQRARRRPVADGAIPRLPPPRGTRVSFPSGRAITRQASNRES